MSRSGARSERKLQVGAVSTEEHRNGVDGNDLGHDACPYTRLLSLGEGETFGDKSVVGGYNKVETRPHHEPSTRTKRDMTRKRAKK